MSVRIRLRRVGKRNAPAHRIVVVDQRSPRDGRFIEAIGTYNPRSKSESVDVERVEYWVSNGAQVSETVAAIVKRAKAGIGWSGTQTAHHRKPAEIKAKPSAEAEEAPPQEAEDTAAVEEPEGDAEPAAEPEADAEAETEEAEKSE